MYVWFGLEIDWISFIILPLFYIYISFFISSNLFHHENKHLILSRVLIFEYSCIVNTVHLPFLSYSLNLFKALIIIFHLEGQTYGLVFLDAHYLPQHLNCDVLLPDRILELGCLLPGKRTGRRLVRPHAWNFYL